MASLYAERLQKRETESQSITPNFLGTLCIHLCIQEKASVVVAKTLAEESITEN